MGHIGRNAKIAVSTDGSTYYDIGKIVTGDFSPSRNLADDTNNDSAGWEENEYADGSVSLSATFRYSETNTGQDMLADESFTNLSGLYFRVRPLGDAENAKEFKFQGKISEGPTVPFATGDNITSSFSAQSSGQVTRTNQPAP